ncbi:MAG: tetratricopeptide repeat protein [Bacteroidia bacterium]
MTPYLRSIALFFLILLHSAIYSQNRELDSLKQSLLNVNDTTKCILLNKISRKVVANTPDSAAVWADSALRLAKRINYQAGLAQSYSNLGHAYNGKGKYGDALASFFASLKIFEKMNNKRAISNVNNSVGNTYSGAKDYEKALEFYLKSYEIASQPPAIEDMMGISCVGIGNCYMEKQDFKKAIPYFETSKIIFTKLNAVNEKAVAIVSLGNCFIEAHDFKNAEKNILESIDIFKSTGEDYGLASSYGILGELYQEKKNVSKAIECYKAALSINSERKAWENIADNARHLSNLYKSRGDFEQALIYKELLMQFKDSILSIERNKVMADASTKYETEKKEQQLKLKHLELEKSQIQVRQRTVLVYVFIGAILVFCVLLFFVLRQYREKKKANSLLETQYREIKEKNNEIEHQKNIIEEKNKDITDSINYSKHIQQAILPSESMIKRTLPNSYFIYKPKDIISGDFYFIENTMDRVYFAVVDCTGHGVPGAMLSVFAQNTLKKIISTRHILPNQVLSEICKEFKSNLSDNNNSTINDGMDIALACIDKYNNKLYFSGAKNPLLLTRNNQLTELKADRWGISGRNEKEQLVFTNHEMELQKGDKIYLFSDGLADQFGGPQGKKFKYKQLQQLILDSSKLLLDEQKKYIEDIFETWRGNLEQLDDVTLMCVSL